MISFTGKTRSMNCTVNDIRLLLDRVQKEAGILLSHSNPGDLYETIKAGTKATPPFSKDYLYKRMQHELNNAEKKGEAELSFRSEYLNYLARYLGCIDYNDFVNKKGKASVTVLAKYTGNWYSYVRCNSGQPAVLRSPVRIYDERNLVYMELQGPDRLFKGELELKGERLFCLLKSGEEKTVHLILNAGIALKPSVLQGVFSGLSSGGDPIAGREILVREESSFEEMKPEKLSIRELLDKETDEKALAIGNYFSKRDMNILKAGRSSSFDLGDLKGYELAR